MNQGRRHSLGSVSHMTWGHLPLRSNHALKRFTNNLRHPQRFCWNWRKVCHLLPLAFCNWEYVRRLPIFFFFFFYFFTPLFQNNKESCNGFIPACSQIPSQSLSDSSSSVGQRKMRKKRNEKNSESRWRQEDHLPTTVVGKTDLIWGKIIYWQSK